MEMNVSRLSLCFSIACFFTYTAVRDELFTGQKRLSQSDVLSGKKQIKDIALPFYS